MPPRRPSSRRPVGRSEATCRRVVAARHPRRSRSRVVCRHAVNGGRSATPGGRSASSLCSRPSASATASSAASGTPGPARCSRMEVDRRSGEGLGAGFEGQALPGVHRDRRAHHFRVGRHRVRHGIERGLRGQAAGRRDARGDRGGVRRLVDLAVPDLRQTSSTRPARARTGRTRASTSPRSTTSWRRPSTRPIPYLRLAWPNQGGTARGLAGPPAWLRTRGRPTIAMSWPTSSGPGPFGWPVADPERIAAYAAGRANVLVGSRRRPGGHRDSTPPRRRARSGPSPTRPRASGHRRGADHR